MKNAEIVKLLFTNSTPRERTSRICNDGAKKQKGAGYKNRITHLEIHHVGFEDVGEEWAKKGCTTVSSMFVPKDAAETYAWTKLVALKTIPLAHVDDPTIRSSIRYKPMDRSTLLKRMMPLVGVVDSKIIIEVSEEKFVLVFDGLTGLAKHAIAIFAATQKGMRFLAFSLFQNEGSMTAAEHIDYLDLVLSQYGQNISDMLAIVADNVSTNKVIARRVGEPLEDIVNSVQICRLLAIDRGRLSRPHTNSSH